VALLAGFERAAERVGVVERGLRAGGFELRLRFAGEGLLDGLLPALFDPLEYPPVEPYATICLFDDASTGVPAPEPPWRREQLRARGDVLGFNDERFGTVCFNGQRPGPEGPRSLSMYDRGERGGVFWVRAPDRLEWWERAAPLRVLLHWALAGERRRLVHAAAVGNGRAGVALVGPSGSGKTTTALACLEAGLRMAGDDFVLLDAGGAEPLAHALYSSAKVEPSTPARLLPELELPHAPAGEKVVVDVAPDRRAATLPVRALVAPVVVGGGPTRLVEASGAEVLSALASPTVLQLPDAGGALRSLAELARSLPAYRLELGGEPDRAAAAVRDLVETLAA
jgi:hypothetical protein